MASRQHTRRQRQIVALVAQGETNRVIGEEVGVSIRTVEAHRLRTMLAVGVHNTAELVAWLSDDGLRGRAPQLRR